MSCTRKPIQSAIWHPSQTVMQSGAHCDGSLYSLVLRLWIHEVTVYQRWISLHLPGVRELVTVRPQGHWSVQCLHSLNTEPACVLLLSKQPQCYKWWLPSRGLRHSYKQAVHHSSGRPAPFNTVHVMSCHVWMSLSWRPRSTCTIEYFTLMSIVQC